MDHFDEASKIGFGVSDVESQFHFFNNNKKGEEIIMADKTAQELFNKNDDKIIGNIPPEDEENNAINDDSEDIFIIEKINIFLLIKKVYNGFILHLLWKIEVELWARGKILKNMIKDYHKMN